MDSNCGEELTTQLNQLNGGKKDWKSWRKVCFVRKYYKFI
jgi:hypothetical protein